MFCFYSSCVFMDYYILLHMYNYTCTLPIYVHKSWLTTCTNLNTYCVQLTCFFSLITNNIWIWKKNIFQLISAMQNETSGMQSLHLTKPRLDSLDALKVIMNLMFCWSKTKVKSIRSKEIELDHKIKPCRFKTK